MKNSRTRQRWTLDMAAQHEQISGPAHCYYITLLCPSQFHPASQGPQRTSKLSLHLMQATPCHNSSLGLCLSALRTDPCKRITWTLEVCLGHMHKKSLEAWFPGTRPRSKGAASSGEAAGPVHATPCGERQPQNRAL